MEDREHLNGFGDRLVDAVERISSPFHAPVGLQSPQANITHHDKLGPDHCSSCQFVKKSSILAAIPDQRVPNCRVKSRPSFTSASELCMAAGLLQNAFSKLSQKSSSGPLTPPITGGPCQLSPCQYESESLPVRPKSIGGSRIAPVKSIGGAAPSDSLLDHLFTLDVGMDAHGHDGPQELCSDLMIDLNSCSNNTSSVRLPTISTSARLAKSCTQVSDTQDDNSSTVLRAHMHIPTRPPSSRGPTSLDGSLMRHPQMDRKSSSGTYQSLSHSGKLLTNMRGSGSGAAHNCDRLIALVRGLSNKRPDEGGAACPAPLPRV